MKTQEMKTQHTPGPWEVYTASTGEVCILAKDGLALATVRKFSTEWEPESDTNAQLLASAPALYEALKGLLEAQDYLCICHDLNGQQCDACKRKIIATTEAVAALASATPQGEGKGK